ncbi:hypothetical protein E0D86_13050 [Pseudomonas sp. IC_126]|nr:hypothetical protein E0D86_13050 [Pseudomonas sp. IC_126]
MVLPCEVPQRRMATFAAQPFGQGLFLRDAAFLAALLERPSFAPRALPRTKTGSGAAANETSTDPSGWTFACIAEFGWTSHETELRLMSLVFHSQGHCHEPHLC